VYKIATPRRGREADSAWANC